MEARHVDAWVVCVEVNAGTDGRTLVFPDEIRQPLGVVGPSHRLSRRRAKGVKKKKKARVGAVGSKVERENLPRSATVHDCPRQ